MIPAPFQSARALRGLNIAAVGFSLAAVVAAAFSATIFRSAPDTALAVGLPTCALGMVWAALLRWPKTMGNGRLRWGWVASVPLAIANSAIAGSLFSGFQSAGFAEGAALGATFGLVFWLPGLLATLGLFGAPIAHAQRLAAKGLAGEERGERIVGLVCLAMSLVGIAGAVALFAAPPTYSRMLGASRLTYDGDGLPVPGQDALSQAPAPILASSSWITLGLGCAGALLGGAATWLALEREARRRRFVTLVEAGEVTGYRVDDTSEGKVLLRVSEGAGYRVADFAEAIFELDPEGGATRRSHGASRLPR